MSHACEYALNTEYITNSLLGDHLGQFSETEAAVVYRHAMQSIKAQAQFSTVLFSGLGSKLSTKGRTDRRALVLTDKGILRLNPDGYKQGSDMTALHLVSALAISPGGGGEEGEREGV